MPPTPDPDRIEKAEHTGGTFVLPHTALSNVIEGIVIRTGNTLSWLWPTLVLLIVLNVVLRYVFGDTSVALEEVHWHIYAVGMIIGVSYALTYDAHVRVDVLAERLSLRTRATIEMLGIVLMTLPFCYIIIDFAIPFVLFSHNTGEISRAPGGLPYRWAIKSFIIIGFAFIALAAIGRLLRCTAAVFGVPKPTGGPDDDHLRPLD